MMKAVGEQLDVGSLLHGSVREERLTLPPAAVWNAARTNVNESPTDMVRCHVMMRRLPCSPGVEQAFC